MYVIYVRGSILMTYIFKCHKTDISSYSRIDKLSPTGHLVTMSDISGDVYDKVARFVFLKQ